MSTILIADDEARIRRLVSDFLKRDGHTIIEAADGKTALELIENRRPTLDLAILDVMMPDMDGFEVLREVREQETGDNHLPVMLLTARAEDADQVRGLEGGADDYVTKPFSLAVLRARVNRLLRRGSAPAAALELGPFSFDFERLRFMRNGTEVELSKTEQRLLRLLVEHRGQTLTREQLLDRVWDGGEFVDANALSVAVKRLRDKLTDAPIKTVYGLGYTWEEKR